VAQSLSLSVTELHRPPSTQVPEIIDRTMMTTTSSFGGCFLHRTRLSFIGLVSRSRRSHLPSPAASRDARLRSLRSAASGWLDRAVRRTLRRATTSTFNRLDILTTCYLHGSRFCPASSYSAAFIQLLQLRASRRRLGLATSPSRCRREAPLNRTCCRLTTTSTLPICRHTCRGIVVI